MYMYHIINLNYHILFHKYHIIFPVVYFLLDEKSTTLNITPISKKYSTQNMIAFQKGIQI